MLPQVGARVNIANYKATVRYVGTLQGQFGCWVGVEWDDPTRGKHDGCTGGVQYFTCASGDTAGSFVRAEKVPGGSALLQALRARYAADPTADAAVYVGTSSHRKVRVEVVGEEEVIRRQSQLGLLTTARVMGACVNDMGPPGELAAALPHLTELDLSDNLLHSWCQVEQLLLELPSLRAVNLTANRLQLPGGTARSATLAVLPNLRCLVLNDCCVTWPQVMKLLQQLPCLTELHVCHNRISCLAPDGDAHSALVVPGFAQLQVLDLDGNQLSQWSEVLRLAALPALERLHLSDNPLTGITYPPAAPSAASAPVPCNAAAGADSGAVAPVSHEASAAAAADQARPFGRLRALLVGDSLVSSWTAVDQLDLFPALAELRLSGTPLLEAAAGGARYEVIGRVGGLTMLNGADIKPRERRDCELRYLLAIAAQLAEAAAERGVSAGSAAGAGDRGARVEEVRRQHPRLAALEAKYGAVVIAPAGAAAARQGTTLASTAVELRLAGPGGKAVTKKLPVSTTVAMLKLLCERLFRVKADRQVLRLLLPGEEAEGAGEDIGEDSTRPLAYFDVQPGSTVDVQES